MCTRLSLARRSSPYSSNHESALAVLLHTRMEKETKAANGTWGSLTRKTNVTNSTGIVEHECN
eukprot:3612973-Amphidinium_carterae.1